MLILNFLEHIPLACLWYIHDYYLILSYSIKIWLKSVLVQYNRFCCDPSSTESGKIHVGFVLF